MKEFLDEKKVTIVFVKTEHVGRWASKPLSQPGKYSAFASFVLGDETLSQPVGVVVFN
jgi:hypothetical protein